MTRTGLGGRQDPPQPGHPVCIHDGKNRPNGDYSLGILETEKEARTPLCLVRLDSSGPLIAVAISISECLARVLCHFEKIGN